MAAYESVMAYSHYDPQVIDAEEASGTVLDWYENDLVKGDGSGLVVIASAAKVLGIARNRATGTANTSLEVELIDPNAIYVIRAPAATATAQAFVHESFDLNFTKGAHYVDTSSTDGEVTIVGIHSGDVLGTLGGRYLVRFTGAVVLAQSGA